MAKRATAADFRRRGEWDVDLDGLTVRVRRIDMATAYMHGWVPLPLMSALNRLIDHGRRLTEDASFIDAIPYEDKESALELMQRFACAAVIDPIFVMTDDGHPDHVPVTMLTSDQLLLIWTSGPPKNTAAEVTPPQADAFRQATKQAAAAAPNGAEIPRQAVVVPDPVVAYRFH